MDLYADQTRMWKCCALLPCQGRQINVVFLSLFFWLFDFESFLKRSSNTTFRFFTFAPYLQCQFNTFETHEPIIFDFFLSFLSDLNFSLHFLWNLISPCSNVLIQFAQSHLGAQLINRQFRKEYVIRRNGLLRSSHWTFDAAYH